MKDWIILIAFVNGFIFGWLGGAQWIEWQWLHCAKNNIVMRIRKKYYFEVKQIPEEEV